MAASKTSARDSVPYLAWAAIQASTNPGTDTDRMPFAGMPFLRYQSTSVAYGAAPVPLQTSMVPGLPVVYHDEAVARRCRTY